MTAVASGARFGVRAGGSRQLAGTWTLLRLALRRDRVMIPLWVAVIGLMVVSMPGSLESVYSTAAERADVADQMLTNSSLRAMYGPVFGDSLGGLTAWRIGTYAGVFAGIMSLLVVVRHTRDEEESGRQEMVSAGMVGRRAPLTSALLAALVANAGLALIITGGLAGQGSSGALALGLGTAGVGMVFATMAAIVAQLTESARLAKGLTGGLLGAAFVLRAAGDSSVSDGSSVLTWLSPVGWLENLRSFADERWWVLLLFIAAVALQGLIAYDLAGRRDVGMSFLPTRPGPASGRLGTAWSLAWRLQRGSVLGWSLGFLAAGVAFGGITTGATDLVGDNERTREIIERMGGQSGITDAFLATMVGMLGMVAALYVVQSVLRLHAEETSQRAEPVLANAVGRLRWASGHLLIAFGGATLIMLIGGLGLSLGYGQDLPTILGACLVQLPAIWTIGGLAVLLHGVSPTVAPAAWAVAGAALLLGWIGPALDLPTTLLNLSPFGHLPKLPGGEMAWTPVLVLTAIAVTLVGVGLGALRRRDIAT
ncbi:ABC-2 type transport system permease protein [Streptomyces umbrinus]|uniref:ABC transporter permease n=1 Tax=Streptomyces umbrinus TaxID=67370 RepID=UPI00167DB018|nr:ABC transporter permease [Streptomyces umbrinus]MCR3726984.1 ABC-2 type transport system permease protein [Streptomyces umbrinus]GHH55377.1 ABC transporter membrane-spanning protein [Streptomyces umbrinus]